MSTDRSRQGLLNFLDYLAKKALLPNNTAMSRKAAVNKVFSILGDEEIEDVVGIDLDDVMLRFFNRHGQNYKQSSVEVYKSRIKSALDDFESFLSNPMGFRPKTLSRERKSKTALPSSSNGQNPEQPAASAVKSGRTNVAPNAVSEIIPIPIRSDLTVRIQGLPFDLTTSEAKKISNVVLAMAVATN